jgi:hypothetical protein
VKIEEGLEHSRVLVLCMSANAFGSNWAQLEAGMCGRGNLLFRDPLNQERRFIPLRLDDATGRSTSSSPARRSTSSPWKVPSATCEVPTSAFRKCLERTQITEQSYLGLREPSAAYGNQNARS